MEKEEEENRVRTNASALLKQFASQLETVRNENGALAAIVKTPSVLGSTANAKQRLVQAEGTAKQAKRYRKSLKTSYDEGKNIASLSASSLVKDLKASIKELDRARDELDTLLNKLRELIASGEADRASKEAPKKRAAGDGESKAKRQRVAKPRGPVEGDVLTPETAQQRSFNARLVATDLEDLYGRVLDPTEPLKKVLRDIGSVIQVINSARALLYSTTEVLRELPVDVASSQADQTDWLEVAHLVQNEKHKASAWFRHCLERHLGDKTLSAMLQPGLDDSVLAKEVDRSILALVDYVASPAAISAKRESRELSVANDDEMDAFSEEDISGSDSDSGDPMFTDAQIQSPSIWDALFSANNNNGTYAASGKDARAPVLSAGQRRRVLDFYALAALAGCAMHLYNVLKLRGDMPATRMPSGIIKAADDLDKTLLSNVLVPLLNRESDDYATLNVADVVKALNGGDVKKAIYVPVSLWHLRGASVADMADRFRSAGITALPKHLTHKFSSKTKKWTERTPESMASDALQLRHLVLEGSSAKTGVIWPLLLVDAIFVWPAITEGEGLLSYTVRDTDALMGVVWPFFSLFDRRGNTQVTIERAPVTTLPSPWNYAYTGGNKQTTALLRGLKTLVLRNPSTPPRSLTLTVMRLEEVVMEALMETQAAPGTSSRIAQQWKDAWLDLNFSESLSAFASDVPERVVRLSIASKNSGARDLLIGLADRIRAKHATQSADLTREERSKRGHDYRLEVTVVADEATESEPTPMPKVKKPKVVVDSATPEADATTAAAAAAAAAATTVDTISIPKLPPYSKFPVTDARVREPIKKVYDILWSRRVNDLVTTNGTWLDDPAVPAEESRVWTQEVFGVLGLTERAREKLSGRVPEGARASAKRLASASYEPPLKPDEEETQDLEWLRYYRCLNFLASVLTNTDTLHCYTIDADQTTIAELDEGIEESGKRTGNKFPVVISPQGVVLWSEWNVRVRVSETASDASRDDARTLIAGDIVPMPWTRGVDSVAGRVIFEHNPFREGVDGLRATDPYNWFSIIGSVHGDLVPGKRINVPVEDLIGLHAIAVAFPALLYSEKPVDETLADLHTEATSDTSAREKMTAQAETLKAEISKLERQRTRVTVKNVASYEALTIRIKDRVNKLDRITRTLKNLGKNTQSVLLTHEDIVLHTHASAIPVLVFHRDYITAVGGSFALECTQKGRAWTLFYQDSLVGNEVALPLLYIQWMPDSRNKAQSNRIRVECPLESVSLLLGATVARTLMTHAMQLGNNDDTLRETGIAALLPDVVSALYNSADQQSLITLWKEVGKPTLGTNSAPFSYREPAKRTLPDVHNAVHTALASAMSFARKITAFTSGSGKAAITASEDAERRVLLGPTLSISDEKAQDKPGYPLAETLASVNYSLTTLLAAKESDPDVVLMDYAAMLSSPELPAEVAMSSEIGERESTVRAALYDTELAPWAATRNHVACAGLVMLALDHLVNHRGAKVGEQSTELRMAVRARDILMTKMWTPLVDNFGSLDLLDVIADYSPLAAHVMIPSRALFGLDLFEGWYETAHVMPDSPNISMPTKKTGTLQVEEVSRLQRLVTIFSRALVDLVEIFELPKDVLDPVTGVKLRTHSEILNVFATALLNDDPVLIESEGRKLVSVADNLLVGDLADLDVRESTITEARIRGASVGDLNMPSSRLNGVQRLKEVRAYARFVDELEQTINKALRSVLDVVSNEHVAQVVTLLRDYINDRILLAEKDEGGDDGEDDSSESSVFEDGSDGEERVEINLDATRSNTLRKLLAKITPLIDTADAKSIVKAIMAPFSKLIAARRNVLERLQTLSGTSRQENQGPAPVRVPVPPPLSKDEEVPIMEGEDDDLFDEDDM